MDVEVVAMVGHTYHVVRSNCDLRSQNSLVSKLRSHGFGPHMDLKLTMWLSTEFLVQARNCPSQPCFRSDAHQRQHSFPWRFSNASPNGCGPSSRATCHGDVHVGLEPMAARVCASRFCRGGVSLHPTLPTLDSEDFKALILE